MVILTWLHLEEQGNDTASRVVEQWGSGAPACLLCAEGLDTYSVLIGMGKLQPLTFAAFIFYLIISVSFFSVLEFTVIF